MTNEQHARLAKIEKRLNEMFPSPWIRISHVMVDRAPSERIDDLLQALEAYLDRKYHPLPPFGDSQRKQN